MPVPLARKAEMVAAIVAGSDTVKASLHASAAFADAAAARAATTYGAVTNEVANGNGYTTGGVAVTPTVTTSDPKVRVDFSDPQWTFTASKSFRWLVLYNVTKGDKVIDVIDLGAQALSGTVTVELPVDDNSNALLRVN